MTDFVDVSSSLRTDELRSFGEACEFVAMLADVLEVPMRTLLAARFYFWRYIATCTVLVNAKDVGMGCLLVACKAEETPVSIRKLLSAALDATRQLSSAPSSAAHPSTAAVEDEQFRNWRAAICRLESDILESSQFNFCPPDYTGALLRVGSFSRT